MVRSIKKPQGELRLLSIFTAIVMGERRYKETHLCILYMFQIDGITACSMNGLNKMTIINQLAIYRFKVRPA